MNCGLDIPKRVAVACSNCRERKIKCITESKDKSCMRCHFNGMNCTYLATDKQRERAVVKAKLAKDATRSGSGRKKQRGLSSSPVVMERPVSHRPAPYPLSRPTPRIAVSPRLKIESHNDRDFLDLDLDLGFAGPSPRLSSQLHRYSAPPSISASPLATFSHLPCSPQPSSSSLDFSVPTEVEFYLPTPIYAHPSPTSSTYSDLHSGSSATTTSSVSYPTPPPSGSALAFDFPAFGCLPRPPSADNSMMTDYAFADDLASYDLAMANSIGFPHPDSPSIYTPQGYEYRGPY